MNNRWTLLITATTIIALCGALLLIIVPGPKKPVAAGIPDIITVAAPLPGTAITSPVTITGSARGTWYFEASFPIQILSASGTAIAQGPAQAQSDWMTTDFVPFKITLTFAKQPAGSHGTLVLKKDNPSGDPAKDQSVSVPVIFN